MVRKVIRVVLTILVVTALVLGGIFSDTLDQHLPSWAQGNTGWLVLTGLVLAISIPLEVRDWQSRRRTPNACGKSRKTAEVCAWAARRNPTSPTAHIYQRNYYDSSHISASHHNNFLYARR